MCARRPVVSGSRTQVSAPRAALTARARFPDKPVLVTPGTTTSICSPTFQRERGMRFGLVIATVTLFTIPQDFLATFARDRDRHTQSGLGAKRTGQSREDKAGIENEGVSWT